MNGRYFVRLFLSLKLVDNITSLIFTSHIEGMLSSPEQRFD